MKMLMLIISSGRVSKVCSWQLDLFILGDETPQTPNLLLHAERFESKMPEGFFC